MEKYMATRPPNFIGIARPNYIHIEISHLSSNPPLHWFAPPPPPSLSHPTDVHSGNGKPHSRGEGGISGGQGISYLGYWGGGEGEVMIMGRGGGVIVNKLWIMKYALVHPLDLSL